MSDEAPGGGVKERLARIESNTKQLLERSNDVERRVRSLEKHRWTTHGVTAVVLLLLKDNIGTVVKKIFSP